MTRLVWAVALSVVAAVPSFAQQITEIPLTTNDLVYDPVSARLYASVPSSAGANGNSIAVINPVTATVERYVPASRGPNQLAVSDDGQYLYVGFDDDGRIRRVRLPSLTFDLEITLPSSSGWPVQARDIAVQPSHPGTVAVSIADATSSYCSRLAVFDGSAMRPIAPYGSDCSITFSTGGEHLFKISSELTRYDVMEAGLLNQLKAGMVFSTSAKNAVATPTLLWGSSGDVVSLSDFTRTAVFAPGRSKQDVVPDTGAGKVYVLFKAFQRVSIEGFSTITGRPLWSLPLTASASSGASASMVGWGTSGLAVRTQAVAGIAGAVFITSLANTNGVTVTKAGSGFGTVTSAPPRISCGATCVGLFGTDDTVTLTAAPDSESVFLGWEGDADCTDGSVTMSSPRSCTAVFARKRPGALTTIPLTANDLVYTPALERLIAAIPSTDPVRGNTVTLIDPATGQIGPSLWVGGEPNLLALSDDGGTLYVGLGAIGAVRSVNLIAMTAGSPFYLGKSHWGHVGVAQALAVPPGSPGAVVVSVKEPSAVVRFDVGISRPTTSSNNVSSLAFGATADRLYAATSANVLYRMWVDGNGVSNRDSVSGVIGLGPLAYAGGRLYSGMGKVIDPETLMVLGTIPRGNSVPFLVEPGRNRVHYMDYPSGVGSALRTYSTAGLMLQRSISLSVSSQSKLAHAGYDRIAIRMGSSGPIGLLYLDPSGTSQDVNGDGSPDIVWWNRLTGEVQVWNMVGGERLGLTSVIGCADVNWRLVARADFNGDGRPDFLWRHAVSGLNEIWYMDGATRLGGGSLQAVPDPAWRVAGAADFNGDTRPDILWRHTTTGEARVWYMDGSQRVGEDRLSTIDPGWQIGGVSDFNGDGQPDLVLRNERTGENVLWYMNGVQRVGYERLKTAPAGWSIGDVMDFNLDGHPDLLWRNAATGQNVVWYLNGAAHLSTQVLPDAGGAWSVLQGPPGQGPGAAHDFNADGLPDLLWHNGATGENVLWLMNGTAVSGKARLPRVTDANWRPVAVGDFNADGKADILWRNASTGENVVWHLDGATHLGNQRLTTVADVAWEVAGAADFDRDGWTDIVWRNQATGENIVWLMTGAQCRQYVRLKSIADAIWVVAGAADFTGDGKPDLLWRNQSTGENIVWQMDGTTYVGYTRVRAVADPAWQVAMAGDFNLDGDSDIVWRNQTTGENIVWHMNRTTYAGYERLATVTDTDWRVVR